MHKYTGAEKPKIQTVSCSVVGARGYSGLETARLLLQHPAAALTACFATSKFELEDYLSSAKSKNISCYVDSELMSHLTDVVFLATPAEVSLELAPKILDKGKKVIDLSGAFRLKKNDYKKWYGFDHTEKSVLSTSNYGLLPWVGPSKNEKLIANPGCYATAISLALIPMLKSDLIHEKNIVIDAKSGTTGAGKKATEALLFSEVESECLPYKVGRHQHYPEIVEAIELFSGKTIDAHMTTSLLPIRRGIIAGVYATLKDGVTTEHVRAAFEASYSNYSLISHASVQTEPQLLSLKKVVGTGKTHISYEVVGNKLYLFSTIDNLLKGAASQAIENFNRISDLPVETGVSHLEALT
jgi:N-acetyl-gamma-glutamyl-phosphate reductase